MSKNEKDTELSQNEKQMSRKERKKLERIEHAKKIKGTQNYEAGPKIVNADLTKSTPIAADPKPAKKVTEEFKDEFIPLPQKKVNKSEVEKLQKEVQQLREAAQLHEQKQKHFIAQSKKLSKERDDAVAAQQAVQQQCEDKCHKYDEIMAQVNLQLLEQEKQIYELEQERKNLKDVVFDLMFEKQAKVSQSPESSPVKVDASLQREYDEKHKSDLVDKQKLLTLLKFANEQIKLKSEQLHKLQGGQPEE